jgi:hypothetical protein
LAASSGASASFFLELSPSSGSPGTAVEGRTIGSGSVTAAANQPLPLFLVSPSAAGQVSAPADPRLIPLGELAVDADGNGATTFAIPDVAPGTYAVLVHCEACAPSSAGRELLVVGDLLVAIAMPSTDTQPPTSGALIVGPAFGAAMLTVVLLVSVVTVRQTVRRSASDIPNTERTQSR